jgi:hypothetical protein
MEVRDSRKKPFVRVVVAKKAAGSNQYLPALLFQ